MVKGFLPSEADREILQEMARAYRQGRLNTPSRSGARPEDTHQASDVYVAYVPEDGIPALTKATGTGSGAYDSPGMALCNIYRINIENSVPYLVPIGYELHVFNLTLSEITRDASPYVLLVKSKDGRWIASVGGSGGGGSNRRLAVAVNDIWQNGSGLVEIWEEDNPFGDYRTTGEQVVAKYDWITTDRKIPAETRLIIEKFGEHWIIVDHGCIDDETGTGTATATGTV